MSAAEVARDMEAVRRAVGDRKLTFLGFSYDRWPAATAAADRRAPYFGRAWGWIDNGTR